MNDHAKRIKELHEVEQMEKYSTPLMSAVLIVLAVTLISFALDVYADGKYSAHVQLEALYVSALNGEPVDTGDGIATCKVIKYELIKGIE